MKIGDVVFLKSGSPELTVISIDGENSGCATVQWESDGVLLTSSFAVAALTNERPETMRRTLFGKEVVLNPHAIPEKIIMHPDTWAVIEKKLLIVTSVNVPSEAAHV